MLMLKEVEFLRTVQNLLIQSENLSFPLGLLTLLSNNAILQHQNNKSGIISKYKASVSFRLSSLALQFCIGIVFMMPH